MMKKSFRLIMITMFLTLTLLIMSCSEKNNYDNNDKAKDTNITSDTTDDDLDFPIPLDVDDDNIPGRDWRTWRAYSNDYVLSEDLTVCFSPFDNENGYAVYDSYSGARIGGLIFNGEYDITNEFTISDHDADGISDIGVIVENDGIIWYGYNPSADDWSAENTGGYFSCIGSTGIILTDVDNSQTEIGVMTQEYAGNNIAEILMIFYDGGQPVFEEYNWKNPEIEIINNTIKSGIQQLYNSFMLYNNFMNNYNEEESSGWIEIKSYPFTSDEWLQIVTTSVIYPTYGTDGDIESYNFNKTQNRYVTYYDAIEDLGLTEEIIIQNVKDSALDSQINDSSISIGEVQIKGFLMIPGESDIYTLFLLEILLENSESTSWKTFYAYVPQLAELYQLSSSCLFDPYDMDEMNPPLSYAQNMD